MPVHILMSDECCLAFQIKSTSYMKGAVDRNRTAPVTDNYLSGYTFSGEPGTDSYLKENELFMGDIFMWDDFMKATVMLNFGENVKDIMKRKGITQEQLAFDLGVNRSILRDYLAPDKQITLAYVVGICIALKLPYDISEMMVSKAGLSLNGRMRHHIVYRGSLRVANTLTIERCEEMLKQSGLPPLFLGKLNS